MFTSQLNHAEAHGYHNKDFFSWFKIDSTLASSIRTLEEANAQTRVKRYMEARQDASIWRCTLCPSLCSPRWMTQAELVEHVAKVSVSRLYTADCH